MSNLQDQIEHDADGAFRVEEFCHRFGVGRTTVYEEINAGRLIAKKAAPAS